MVKTTRKRRNIPTRRLKGGASFDHQKFANKLARIVPTAFSGLYQKSQGIDVNPALAASSYQSSDAFRHDYLLYNLLRKFNAGGAEDRDMRASRAYDLFLRNDKALSCFNDNLSFSILAVTQPVAHKILWRAACKIGKLLGPLTLDRVEKACAFSHGASALHSRREGRAPYKFSNENPEVTPACAELAWTLIQRSPIWAQSVKSLTLCEYNRLTTVPKDETIDRVIACEPTMNMYVQKGIGALIRRRLKTVNIDLNDQSINQRLALQGSLSGELATVDLSAASDSVSLAICKLLLPSCWYDILLMTRCDVGKMPDGTLLEYEKVSSMGNGYTFELESLLFWGITQACEDFLSDTCSLPNHQCSVYGDDIVCRTSSVDCLRYILRTCGFSLNDDKSFWEGPFRESCGKHYFNGTDVSPFFIREPVNDITSLIGLCNRLRRWNRQCLGIDDPRYVDIYDWARAYLPEFWQVPRIPDSMGDGALIGYLDEVRPNFSNGVHRAVVLVNHEHTISPKDERPESMKHRQVQHGLGGYIECLHSLNSRPVSSQSGEASMREASIPGAVSIRAQRVLLTEWSD